MYRDSRAATIGMTSRGFRTGGLGISSSDNYRLGTDKLSIEFWFTVLKEHGDYFPQVVMQLVQCFTLRMRTWKARHISNIQVCIGVLLYHRHVRFHPPLQLLDIAKCGIVQIHLWIAERSGANVPS